MKLQTYRDITIDQEVLHIRYLPESSNQIKTTDIIASMLQIRKWKHRRSMKCLMAHDQKAVGLAFVSKYLFCTVF